MSATAFAAIARGNLAVVTGVAGAIGQAAAQAFAAAGMRVVLVDRAGDALDALAESIEGAFPCAVDVADRTSVDDLARRIAERYGPVSVLLNSTGVAWSGDVFADPVEWTETIGVNLLGVLHSVQSFVPKIVASGSPGLVINTVSEPDMVPPLGNTAYHVSKVAVKALTEGLADTLRQSAGDRVTAHLLCPGLTLTGATPPGRTEKTDSACSPAQIAAWMMTRLEVGDFYIERPDSQITLEQDLQRGGKAPKRRSQNRPAL